MLHQDTAARLQFAREHADRLAAEMRRTRQLDPDEAGYPHWGRLAAGLFVRVGRLRHGKSGHVPAYHA